MRICLRNSILSSTDLKDLLTAFAGSVRALDLIEAISSDDDRHSIILAIKSLHLVHLHVSKPDEFVRRRLDVDLEGDESDDEISKCAYDVDGMAGDCCVRYSTAR